MTFTRFDCLTWQDNLLTQIVDEPTRGNNILDLAFVSDPSFVEDCRIDEPFGMSDHKSVVLSVRFPVSRQNTLTRKIYLYSQGDYQSLSNERRDINWENKFSKKSVNDCWMLLKNTYNDLVNTFVPSKTIKPGKRHGQPWTRYKSVTQYFCFVPVISKFNSIFLDHSYRTRRFRKMSSIFPKTFRIIVNLVNQFVLKI
jgi:hypothetical protein